MCVRSLKGYKEKLDVLLQKFKKKKKIAFRLESQKYTNTNKRKKISNTSTIGSQITNNFGNTMYSINCM